MFSRNPISGDMEGYSDEGGFEGHVVTMADFIKSIAMDGGPGSGNWGHKGRPGHVGGSGPGGGSQYRGGRSEIGYFGSRKDWLNGLSGEKQHEASKFLKTARENHKKYLKESKEAKEVFTAPKYEEIAKRWKYDKLKDDMTPEEFTMACGMNGEKKELLDYVGEARSWDDRSNKLITENLSNEDRKYLSMLLMDIHSNDPDKLTREDYFNGNLDRVFDDLNSEQKEFYLDMKAKACGLPTSGKDISEYSDIFQISVGAKEPPPKVSIPQTREENEKYVEKLPEEKKNKLVKILQEAGYNPYDQFSNVLNMQYAENRLLNSTQYGDRDAVLEAARYLNAKEEALNAQWFKSINDFEFSPSKQVCRLSANASDDLKKFMNVLLDEAKETNPDATIENMGDVLEMSFLQDKDVQGQYKHYYLTLKAMALGYEPRWGTDSSYSIRLKEYAEERKNNREEEKKFSELRKNFKQNRASRESEYDSAKTSKEVGEAMHRSGMFRNGSSVIFVRTSTKCAKEAAKSYEKVFDKYPFLVGQLDGPDEAEHSSSSYASCAMNKGGRVHLNASPKFFGDFGNLEGQYNDDLKTGWHPQGTDWTSVVTHELGHSLDGFLSKKRLIGSVPSSIDTHSFSGVLRRRVLKKLHMTKAQVGAELSRYAQKNAWEWFAECFAEAMHSPNPRPMATEMMRQLDEILREEGLING